VVDTIELTRELVSLETSTGNEGPAVRLLADLLAGMGYNVARQPVSPGRENLYAYLEPPELVFSKLSDDLAGIASAVAHGLRHHRAGRLDEALWSWQFSYVSSWGAEASAALRALQSVISHDRLDTSRL